MAKQRFYEKTGVQSALAGGLCVLLAAAMNIWYMRSELKKENTSLKKEKASLKRQSDLQKRRDAMRHCLNEFIDGSSIQVDFYDSRRMADWVESHPASSMWLRQRITKPLKGWRPYGPWAYGEDDVGIQWRALFSAHN